MFPLPSLHARRLYDKRLPESPELIFNLTVAPSAVESKGSGVIDENTIVMIGRNEYKMETQKLRWLRRHHSDARVRRNDQ